MKKIQFLILALIIAKVAQSQIIYTPDYVHPKDLNENYIEKIYSDSLASSFLMVIVKDIELHKHVNHTEHIYVLEGTGDMHIGDENINVLLFFTPCRDRKHNRSDEGLKL